MQVVEHRVDSADWRGYCADLSRAGATMWDMLTAVDDPERHRMEVVVHLVDVAAARRHLVWTQVDRDPAELDSLTAVFPGAAWHEREVHEMFALTFLGHPDLSPLLTTGDMGAPLRRTTPLPARIQTPWPGSSDPADRPAPGRGAARPRSRPGPPGVPEQWAR